MSNDRDSMRDHSDETPWFRQHEPELIRQAEERKRLAQGGAGDATPPTSAGTAPSANPPGTPVGSAGTPKHFWTGPRLILLGVVILVVGLCLVLL